MKTREQWEYLFRSIGVADAKLWAALEFDERVGNLARLAFVRELWQLVPGKNDKRWLQRWVAYEAGTQPESCAAYTRLIDAGAKGEDLVALVRGVMSELVQQTVAVLDEGKPHDLDESVAEQIQWRLCEVDEDRRLVPLHGLHELADGDEVQELKR